uniref:Interleukin-7 n=1 Tax=Mastacembelus armatus TaxID=205130 RepID=A0A3Q3NIV4_9TELE
MPLLCLSLLALLLLPLCLSCDSKRPPEEVRIDYIVIIQTDLDNTRESITTLLQNSSCSELKHRIRSCTSSNVTNVVSTLHIVTCKMKTLRLSHTDGLVRSVLRSIHCPCLEKPTKEPSIKLRKRRRTRRQRRNEQKKSKREIKKLCKAMVILSTLNECYEMMNTLLMHT